MRKLDDGRIIYAPRDLVEFMASPFAAWMSRLVLDHPDRAVPDERTEEDAILQEQGEKHEHAYLEKLTNDGREVCTIASGLDAPARTLAAMAAGRDVIYQGALEDGTFSGRTDFLLRGAGHSRFGDWRYDVIDTKLARSPRPDFLVQLCAYAEMLASAQGCTLEHVTVVLGTNEERHFRLADFRWFYRLLRAEFLRFMRSFNPDAAPDPEPRAEHGRWTSEAERFFSERDHLVRVAGIRSGQIARLREAGILTVAQLAGTALDRVPRISNGTFEGLRLQAQLQVASRNRARPEYRVLQPGLPDRPGLAALPPPSKLDVFFDMEGYPHELEGGLEYLFGAATSEGDGKFLFHDWWAHDRAEERRAFADFVGWVHDRWRRDRRMHVYHYAPYEVTALKKLMGRHGACEMEVDDLLRNEVFVDLYRVVRHGVRVGTSGYSLKDLEALYQERRAGGVKTAGDSIVAYHGWRARNEPRDWRTSPALKLIRDYNCEDCFSLARLLAWLRARQVEAAIAWVPRGECEVEEVVVRPERDDALMARKLLDEIPQEPAARAEDPERWRIQELLAHLCEFHRREDKVFWWSVFDRCAMTHEELAEDLECLGNLEREKTAPIAIKQSTGYWYRYDPDQDTKLDAGDTCAFSHDWTVQMKIEKLDRETGRVLLKMGDSARARIPGRHPPEIISLIPFERVNPAALAASVMATAQEWKIRGKVATALADLLARRPPRIRRHAGGSLAKPGESAQDAGVRIVDALDGTTLVVQGPPGGGKTTTGARMILRLLQERGRRVGIAANSHEAILNLMVACAAHAGGRLDCLKVGGREDHALYTKCRGARRAEDNAAGVKVLGRTPLVGGTAWFFARAECEGKFDTLFVDEAGQVSLGNLVAMSRAARNLVLLGDQCQLAQPIQASHPGESGLSALDYYLQGRATIPEDRGLFLGTTWRLHPAICTHISESFYEGRLRSDPSTANRVVCLPTGGGRRVCSQAGLVYVPVTHDGNVQSSEEEAAVVRELVEELRGRDRTDLDGRPGQKVTDTDILVVAPYNAQVRLLRRMLKPGVRVGTVDKFQGQQAAVVIVSMCASDAEASPRGLAFLLSPNRLNVALSRAQSLAIVVGSPALARTRASSIEEMRLLNLYARIAAVRITPPAP